MKKPSIIEPIGIQISDAELERLGLKKDPEKQALYQSVGIHSKHEYPFKLKLRGKEIQIISVSLGDAFGDGFPQMGFEDAAGCDKAYVRFRFMWEIADKVIRHASLLSKTGIKLKDAIGSKVDSCHLELVLQPVRSSKDIEAVISAVQEYDKVSTDQGIGTIVTKLVGTLSNDLNAFADSAFA